MAPPRINNNDQFHIDAELQALWRQQRNDDAGDNSNDSVDLKLGARFEKPSIGFVTIGAGLTITPSAINDLPGDPLKITESPFDSCDNANNACESSSSAIGGTIDLRAGRRFNFGNIFLEPFAALSFRDPDLFGGNVYQRTVDNGDIEDSSAPGYGKTRGGIDLKGGVAAGIELDSGDGFFGSVGAYAAAGVHAGATGLGNLDVDNKTPVGMLGVIGTVGYASAAQKQVELESPLVNYTIRSENKYVPVVGSTGEQALNNAANDLNETWVPEGEVNLASVGFNFKDTDSDPNGDINFSFVGTVPIMEGNEIKDWDKGTVPQTSLELTVDGKSGTIPVDLYESGYTIVPSPTAGGSSTIKYGETARTPATTAYFDNLLEAERLQTNSEAVIRQESIARDFSENGSFAHQTGKPSTTSIQILDAYENAKTDPDGFKKALRRAKFSRDQVEEYAQLAQSLDQEDLKIVGRAVLIAAGVKETTAAYYVNHSDKVAAEMKSDPDLIMQITGGYSPDGWSGNTALAGRRAEALKKYYAGTYGIPSSRFSVSVSHKAPNEDAISEFVKEIKTGPNGEYTANSYQFNNLAKYKKWLKGTVEGRAFASKAQRVEVNFAKEDRNKQLVVVKPVIETKKANEVAAYGTVVVRATLPVVNGEPFFGDPKTLEASGRVEGMIVVDIKMRDKDGKPIADDTPIQEAYEIAKRTPDNITIYRTGIVPNHFKVKGIETKGKIIFDAFDPQTNPKPTEPNFRSYLSEYNDIKDPINQIINSSSMEDVRAAAQAQSISLSQEIDNRILNAKAYLDNVKFLIKRDTDFLSQGASTENPLDITRDKKRAQERTEAINFLTRAKVNLETIISRLETAKDEFSKTSP